MSPELESLDGGIIPQSIGATNDIPPPRSEQLSAEVVDFCNRREALSVLESAVRMAKQYFRSTDVSVYLSGDPEGDDEWIVVSSRVSGTIETVLNSYADLKSEWLKKTPSSQIDLFRFLFDIH